MPPPSGVLTLITVAKQVWQLHWPLPVTDAGVMLVLLAALTWTCREVRQSLVAIAAIPWELLLASISGAEVCSVKC